MEETETFLLVILSSQLGRSINKPVLVIELKWNKAVYTAINQIKERDYPELLKGLSNDMLLVGLNYDEETKKHTCVIEKYVK